MDRYMARTDDVVVEELDGGLVIYDGREAQAHWLDPSATAVWRACRLPSAQAEIVGGAGLDEQSCETVLSQLIDVGLVEAQAGSGYSRRVVLRTAAKVGVSGAIAAPVISAFVPMAAAAASGTQPPPPPPPPPSGNTPLTPGYWKTKPHEAQTTALLPQKLGGYTVGTFTQAQAVFGAMNCGASTSEGAVGCLAGHLLAAELNVANGASVPPCASTAISQANTFLTGIGYTGPSGTYTLTSAQRAQAISLKTTLDNYDNGNGSGC